MSDDELRLMKKGEWSVEQSWLGSNLRLVRVARELLRKIDMLMRK